MNASTLSEVSYCDILGLKFTPDLEWDSYIQSIGKHAGKMVGYYSRKYPTTFAMLYLYKSQISLPPPPKKKHEVLLLYLHRNGSSLHIPTLIGFKIIYGVNLGKTCFLLCNLFPPEATLQSSHNSLLLSGANVQLSSLVSDMVETLASRAEVEWNSYQTP